MRGQAPRPTSGSGNNEMVAPHHTIHAYEGYLLTLLTEGRGHRSVDRPEQFWELEIGRGDPKDLEIL